MVFFITDTRIGGRIVRAENQHTVKDKTNNLKCRKKSIRERGEKENKTNEMKIKRNQMEFL